jgi:1-acyl-sn-glycerol-3-phosphate acyltransferase
MSGIVPRVLGRVARVTYVVCGAAVIAGVMLTLWVVTFLVRRRPQAAVALQSLASRIMLACLGCRFTVLGERPPSGRGAYMFVSNHTSYLDIPLMLAALRRDFAFVTKRELLEWPVISLITRAGAHIPVDRDRAESRGAVLARMVRTLRAGRDVFVFPEGTFSHDHGLRPFHSGAFKAALAAGVPVVPIATKGVAGVWSQHARFPRSGAITIWIGQPLTAAAGEGGEERRVETLRDAAARFIEGHARAD